MVLATLELTESDFKQGGALSSHEGRPRFLPTIGAGGGGGGGSFDFVTRGDVKVEVNQP